jgi:hypothetical protein
MNKFNIKFIKNSDPLKYFENHIEHYSYEYDTLVYMRLINNNLFAIKIIKNIIENEEK